MKIAIIADNYPSKGRPVFTFVQQLVHEIVDLGHDVYVIAPQSLTHALIRKNKIRPKFSIGTTKNGNTYKIYRPYTITFSNHLKKVSNFTYKLKVKSISKIIKGIMPDVIYGHFWHSAYSGYEVAKELNIPLFVASGESTIKLKPQKHDNNLKEFANYVKGVVCVSTKNKNESIALGLTTAEKCIVIPNAIDVKKFYKIDKSEIRKKLGYSETDFIVIFVGSFIERKGANRVSEAINKLNDPSIKSIFIGNTMSNDNRFIPQSESILYKGPVEHNLIVNYLNCADVFVLPTLHEGCCNAIVEAMACGLPIISSDKEFNYDILDSSCSILINPMDIDQISENILKLKNDSELRKSMSISAYNTSLEHHIDTRTAKIMQYIIKSL